MRKEGFPEAVYPEDPAMEFAGQGFPFVEQPRLRFISQKISELQVIHCVKATGTPLGLRMNSGHAASPGCLMNSAR